MDVINKISAYNLNKMMEDVDFSKTNMIIDVRSEGEYIKGHIPGAINISYENFMAFDSSKLVNVDKTKNIVIYCDRGGRSIYVVRMLMEMGYNVSSLAGGYMEFLKTTKI